MNQEEMKEYMEAQCYEIAVYKWIESEKAGRDLGDQACMDWIKKYAPSFRKYWEETHKENA